MSQPAPQREETVERPAWPPSKEELARLYLGEKLTAKRISEIYGLPNLVRVYVLLKKHAIPTRNLGGIPQFSPERAAEWARRYEAGESLEQIAGTEVSPFTVHRYLVRRGVKIRSLLESSKLRRDRRMAALFGDGGAEIRRLYLEERLSCPQIAGRLGLSDPKASGTVRRALKSLGVPMFSVGYALRRYDAVAPQWVERYRSGESAYRIAKGVTSEGTVYRYLRESGVQIREASAAHTKYARSPFDGDEMERAYLLGFVRGDVHVCRHGTHLRCTTGSTHAAQLELFTSLFAPYGPVRTYAHYSRVCGFAWEILAEVDSTFDFLLKKSEIAGISGLTAALSYLAGLFDAEGCLSLATNLEFAPHWSISNSDPRMRDWVTGFLTGMGLHPSPCSPRPDGVANVCISQPEEVVRLVRLLPIRHPEKKEKARLVIDTRMPAAEKRRRWFKVLDQIRSDRDESIREAERVLAAKGRGATNSVLGLMICLRYLWGFKKFPLDGSIWAETLNWLGEYVEDEETPVKGQR